MTAVGSDRGSWAARGLTRRAPFAASDVAHVYVVFLLILGIIVGLVLCFFGIRVFKVRTGAGAAAPRRG